MVLRMLIDAVHSGETRVVIAEGTRIHDFDFVTAAKKQVKGNIYLAKITRVEPSLQAAFVEYGGGKQGFLPFAEIHPDYYQIPMADRKRLIEEAEEAADDEDDESHAAPAASDAAAEAAEIRAERREEAEASAAPVFGEVIEQGATPVEANRTEQEPNIEIAVHNMPEDTNVIHVPVAAAVAQDISITAELPAVDAVPADGLAHAEPATVASEHGEQNHEIETLASDEDAVRQTRTQSFSRRYKIQEVIKRNQIVLVQVIKEERGNKGVSLTTFISLAGRYCVLMPNSPKGGGISRKIMSGEDRKRLKEISSELKGARGMSAIIRTAGIDRTRAEIKRDYEYLVMLWESIREQTLNSTAPALIYEEGDLIKRTFRDLYSGDIEEVLIEGEAGFEQAKEFLKLILPSHAPKVKLYQEPVPLFYAYSIEDQLASMYDPAVKLRSGGYIVLNPTEALISIDVNSGRSTGERNIEETATKTNLEAAHEIARQLRLRDLAGLIVIDFIDMMDSRNRRAVERALKDALRLDRAKIQIGRISPFGLMEMSRQRLRPSLSETSSMPCPHCQGRGLVRSDASVAIQVIRAMEKEAASGLLTEIKLTVTPSVALHLLNSRREALSTIEQKYGTRVVILSDDALAQSNFRLEKIKGAAKKNANGQANEPVSVDHPKMMEELPSLEPEEMNVESPSEPEEIVGTLPARGDRGEHGGDRQHRRGRRGGRGRRRGGRDFNDRPERTEGVQVQSEDNVQSINAEHSGESAPPREHRPHGDRPQGDRPRGDRGGRGGRGRGGRWRDRRGERDRHEGGDASAAPMAATGDHAPVVAHAQHRSERPAQPRGESSSVPPLTAQAPSDIKPKKGWWRRIVE